LRNAKWSVCGEVSSRELGLGMSIEQEGFGRCMEVFPVAFEDHYAVARLIAAAPDMLAALEQIVWKVDQTSGYPEIRKDIVLKMARSAIVKATGNRDQFFECSLMKRGQ
jgi:hypothetical protein